MALYGAPDFGVVDSQGGEGYPGLRQDEREGHEQEDFAANLIAVELASTVLVGLDSIAAHDCRAGEAGDVASIDHVPDGGFPVPEPSPGTSARTAWRGADSCEVFIRDPGTQHTGTARISEFSVEAAIASFGMYPSGRRSSEVRR